MSTKSSPVAACRSPSDVNLQNAVLRLKSWFDSRFIPLSQNSALIRKRICYLRHPRNRSSSNKNGNGTRFIHGTVSIQDSEKSVKSKRSVRKHTAFSGPTTGSYYCHDINPSPGGL